jgi:hypothetical protein
VDRGQRQFGGDASRETLGGKDAGRPPAGEVLRSFGSQNVKSQNLTLLAAVSERTTPDGANERITRVSARTLFDSKSEPAKLSSGQTDQSQKVSIGSLNQESSGSNATGFAEAVVGAAVRAALGKQANSAASEPGEIPANASPASGWAAIRSVSPRHFGLRSCLRPQFQLPLEPPEIRS